MSEFELLRNITLGQYLPTGSYLHRMDPRAKIVATLMLAAAVSFTPTLAGNAVLLAVCLGVVVLGRIPVRYALRGLLPAVPLLVILAVMQLLFFGRAYDPSSPVVFRWGWIVVTAAVVRLVLVSAARFVELLFVTSVFTLTTTTTELTHGIESLLRPFRRFRVPAHELALVVTIAIRFVPTLALEAERLMKAQASRGGRIGGSRWQFIERTRQLLPILVPLFTFALRRGEELIVAMEARAYTGGAGRTTYAVLQGRAADWLVPAAALAFLAAMLRAPFPV
ncbi:MAG TPA: energy-coupling factor transporter transmembrane component T [bacterium]|nr:energy-coupling factor transporter transmembrane component T [bacterium]